MHIALPNAPPADCWAAAAAHLPVERSARPGRLLLDGYADLALVPALEVLLDPDAYCVLPGAALSTWANPYVRLTLPFGLADLQSVSGPKDAEMETLTVRIVLREHYGAEPVFVAPDPDKPQLLTGQAAVRWEGKALDLGQEWFELAGYPMVWGLWVMRPGEASPAAVDMLWTLVEDAERRAIERAGSADLPGYLRRFYRDDLRFRLDDLAIASVTKLSEYLWYHDETAEPEDLKVYRPPDEEDTPWYAAFQGFVR